ncbi:MAG: CopD family protein [Burkholderiaceae bacterium]|nr:CopD family protein [Burkholderiaceae bacterium]
MTELWLFLHFVAVVTWIGGMVFAHFCLRPAALATLQPPQRLPLMAAALGRFFALVGASLVLLWGSGLAMFAGITGSGGKPPLSWNLMAAIAAVMTLVFLWIVLRLHPRMRSAVAACGWPNAAAALDAIRRLVVLNLALGFLTIAVATLGRLAN